MTQLLPTANEEKVSEAKAAAKEILDKLPISGLDMSRYNEKELLSIFNDSRWDELSEACLACGTCTYVCPTCQCYDIREFDTGHGIKRFRCWDSCMYADFTKEAPATRDLHRCSASDSVLCTSSYISPRTTAANTAA